MEYILNNIIAGEGQRFHCKFAVLFRVYLSPSPSMKTSPQISRKSIDLNRSWNLDKKYSLNVSRYQQYQAYIHSVDLPQLSIIWRKFILKNICLFFRNKISTAKARTTNQIDNREHNRRKAKILKKRRYWKINADRIGGHSVDKYLLNWSVNIKEYSFSVVLKIPLVLEKQRAYFDRNKPTLGGTYSKWIYSYGLILGCTDLCRHNIILQWRWNDWVTEMEQKVNKSNSHKFRLQLSRDLCFTGDILVVAGQNSKL